MKKSLLLFFLYVINNIVIAQNLQSGFNPKESIDMLALSFQKIDSSALIPKVPQPSGYYHVYQSPEVGLSNQWNLWYRNDNKLAVISIRGSVNQAASWLENYYAAMVPAIGTLQLNDSTIFNYQLSADVKANVHTGWLIGLGFLSPSIVAHIKATYNKGIRDIIITGHSQGAALAILTRSYLFYLAQKNEIPKDLIFKTYASAAPKPGNLYYAYDFDFITRNGWAFTIINNADWVPETPFSIQTFSNFNPLNPFANFKQAIQKQSFFNRLFINYKLNKINKATKKSQQLFQKNLGSLIYKRFIKKILPQLKEPSYVQDNNYQKAGSPIILQANADYYKKFPNQTTNVFQHHLFLPYSFLIKHYYPSQ